MSDDLMPLEFEDDPYWDYPDDMDERTDADPNGRHTVSTYNAEPKAQNRASTARVVAPTHEEAEEVASRTMSGPEGVDVDVYGPVDGVIASWTDVLPFGGKDDKTCRQYLEEARDADR